MADINEFNRQALIQREATPGTAETLSASEGITDLRELGVVEPDFKPLDNQRINKGTFGPPQAQHELGAATLAANLTVPIRAPSAAGDTPPDIAEILAACGLAETINAGTDVVYQPATPSDLTAAPAATIEIYEAGKKYQMVGARGDFTINAQAGQQTLLQANFRAPWATPTGGNTPPDVAAPSGSPLVFTGAVAITEDGADIAIGSLELAWQAELNDDVDSTGVRILRTNWNPVLRINPWAVASAVEWDKLINATSVALKADWTGMVLDAPQAQLLSMGSEIQNRRIRRTQEWQLNESAAGDDQFTLTFK